MPLPGLLVRAVQVDLENLAVPEIPVEMETLESSGNLAVLGIQVAKAEMTDQKAENSIPGTR